ncbi:MAG: AAA family ATPase, partial [Lactobacillus sp.]|nr:AAA family ATPase [Lactobacillus sp.]
GATPKQQKMNYIKTFSYLRKGLETLKDDYDLVIIDCPPNFSVVTKNALIASDYYVIPTKMDYLSTLGINQLRNHVNTLVREYNGFCEPDNCVNPVLLGVVANMISIYGGNPIRAQQDYIEEIQRNKIPLFSSMVRENKTLFSSRPEYAEPVILQDHSVGTYADIVSELEALQAEFEKKAGV